MVSVWRHSPISNEVMRNPERAKNRSTPLAR